MAGIVSILLLDLGIIMKIWVNLEGWLVIPYVNVPKPGDFIEIELSAEDTIRFLNGTIFKYINGKLTEHGGVVIAGPNNI